MSEKPRQRSGRTPYIRALIIASTILAAGSSTEITTKAVTSTTGKSFFYWGHESGEDLPEHIDHVSATFNADGAHVVAELQALPPDLKMIVPAFYVLAPDGCSLNPNGRQEWDAAAVLLTPYISKIAAIFITDEPDLRAINNCFQWLSPLDRQIQMANLMTQASAVVKTTNLPGWSQIKTYVNYGATFRDPDVPIAQNIDMNSFDCYGPFDNCEGTGASIPQLVDIMASKLNPATQTILLVSDASCFKYHELGRKTHESELFIRAAEYWQLAKTHPRVSGLVGFIWDYHATGNPHPYPEPSPIHTISDSRGLSLLYRNIGLNLLTNFIPSTSSITVAPECVIPAGGGACVVNFSWTLTNGPSVTVFGRLVGQQDNVSPPLCPGATACSVPAGVGDYILELRKFNDPNSRLIDAKRVKVRYASAPTGQITFLSSGCSNTQPGGCVAGLTANTQNAPGATFFFNGTAASLCAGVVSLCQYNPGLPPGAYPFTVQLRATSNPSSQILDQRPFPFTVTP